MTNLSIILIGRDPALAEQTLNEILCQSIKDFEVILAVPFSNKQLDKLKTEASDIKVTVIESDSYSEIQLWNKAIKLAKGEYIHFINAGDHLLDFAYEAVCDKANKFNLDILQFKTIIADENGSFIDVKPYTLNDLRPGDYNLQMSLRLNSQWYRTNKKIWSYLYRRSFLEEKKIVFKDIQYFAQKLFSYEAIAEAERAMICGDRLLIHSRNKVNNISIKDYDECFLSYLEHIEKRFDIIGIEDKIQEDFVIRAFKDYTDKAVAVMCEFDDETGTYNHDAVIDEMDSLTSSYSGKYSGEIKRRYLLNERKRILTLKPSNNSPTEYTLYHEACECPKVTVIVPTMNVEDYLNLALNSLSEQTLEEMQFIVLNDGSTDNSMTIIKEYASLDKRFEIIDKPNSGYGNTMNIGINSAKGEYLGILEPDDYVTKGMFKDLYNIAVKNDLDLIKADFYRFKINQDGSMSKVYNKISKDNSFYGRLVDTSEEQDSFKFIMNTWSGIYKLDFLNKYNIRHNETPGASYQDNGFWFQTFCRAKRAWFVNKPYYMNRRDNPNSSMFSKKKEFCVTEEYNYIYKWMEADPEIKQKYSDIFYFKKFSNFMLTYRRLSADLKQDYLYHLRDEFLPAMKNGKLNRELFGENAWKHLNEILDDPKVYHEKIRVSVIIPVFNAENYIRKCLDSILLWDELRIEVICVDDGSTDKSLDILKEYAENDSRVTVISQENGGAGAARNNGMRYAKGEYLSFLDADDYFEYDMLYKAYERAYVDKPDITVFRSDQFYEETGEIEQIDYTINRKLLPSQQPFCAKDVQYDIFKLFVGWTWDKLFRSDFVKQHGLQFQEQRTTNDMLFVFSAIIKAEKINTMNAVLAHHRKSESSLSVTREKSWDCFYNALIALKRQLIEWDLYEKYERDFINYAQHFALWNIETIQGASYFKLFNKLQNEWIANLDIDKHDRSYFYNTDEYERMQRLMTISPEDFLFYQIEKKKTELKRIVEKQKKTNSDLNETKNKVKSITEQNALLKKRIKKSKKKLIEVQNELEQDKEALKKVEAQLGSIKDSTARKTGSLITNVPGKIKRLFKTDK